MNYSMTLRGLNNIGQTMMTGELLLRMIMIMIIKVLLDLRLMMRGKRDFKKIGQIMMNGVLAQ